MPPGLERIMRRCLEKNPEERFQAAHDLALALEAESGAGHSTQWIPRALLGAGTASPLRRRS